MKIKKVLFISLVATILAVLGSIVYFAVVPQQNEKFSEFYVLGTQGKAGDYPQQVLLGENVGVIIGVVNHEYQSATYRVEITVDGIKNKEVDIGTLTHQQKWELEVSFATPTLGDGQKVEFWLYKDNRGEPYLEDPLRLYIDVRQLD